MKLTLGLLLISFASTGLAQSWKIVPKGVRIVGYRNVTTSTIKSNYNQFGSETSMSPEFKIDGGVLNQITKNAVQDNFSQEITDDLTVGEYKVDASANAKVHGFGLGWGLTDNIMLYGEIAYYNFNSQAKISRTKGNNYRELANRLRMMGYSGYTEAQLIEQLVDVNERNVQSAVTDYFGYEPVGDWNGQGYGDMETGVMYKAIDKGTWGVLLYPGLILPTGRQDDPDIIQDVAFGDGQTDVFGEIATGYVVNDTLTFGTSLRYTHQLATEKELRVPTDRDFPLAREKGTFQVKYGDKINWMINAPITINDWVSVIPFYRFMYQMPTQYESEFSDANKFLSYNSDKMQHEVQLTTSLSSITPFLKKKFVLPAQINFNVVQVVGGKNVPKMGRLEVELRMVF